MKFNGFLKASSIVTCVIFTLFFIIPIAQASESGNDAESDTTMTFHEPANDSEQIEALEDIVNSKNNTNKASSSSELCLSLDEKLQWFFSFDKPDFIDDPYESQDYDNYRATFGIHIVL